MELEQWSHANPESGAKRRMLNTFVLLQGERNGREEVWVGKVLLLFCRSVRGESREDELSFVRYVECVAPWMLWMRL